MLNSAAGYTADLPYVQACMPRTRRSRDKLLEALANALDAIFKGCGTMEGLVIDVRINRRGAVPMSSVSL